MSKLKQITAEAWWAIIIASSASIIFGVLTIVWPGLTLEFFARLFAAFGIIIGFVGLLGSLAAIQRNPLWWLGMLFALGNVALAAYLFHEPKVTAVIFATIIAIYVVIQSLIDLVVASFMKEKEHKSMWVITGALGLAAAIVIIIYPTAASVAFAWVVGMYAFIHGIVGLSYAFQLRRVSKKLFLK